MRRALSTLLTAVAILTAVAVADAASAGDNPEQVDVNSRATADYAELWARQKSRAVRAAGRGDARTVSQRRGVRLQKAYVPACEGNSPDARTNRGNLCRRATTMCVGDQTDQTAYWPFTAPVGTDDWSATGELVCRGPANPGDPAAPPVEPVVTVEDFRRLPLPAARINVQPPDRRTLVNIPTNLYTQAKTVTLPTTILGRPIRVRATPQNFTWAYGDGTTRTTTDPGGPYPELSTAHVYRAAGTPRLTLTTTYTGEYAIAGGPWQPIEGTAAVTGPSTALEVLTAQNRLVAEPIT